MEVIKSVVTGTEQEVIRPSGEYFAPDIWGDYFINLLSTNEVSEEWAKMRVDKLIKEVKVMLKDATDLVAKMHMIDALERLGVDYHFEKEIDYELHQIYKTSDDCYDLHAISLRFRLLRQHRYDVPSEVFKKFKDDEGMFKAILKEDLVGLLSLYDATYLGTPQEDILNEANEFARSHLKSVVNHLKPPLAAKVSHALETPLHRRMRRLEARLYISIYQEDVEACNNIILELAKLDFHLLQLIHRQEIKTICMWWKELGLSKQSFARERVVECYFWILGVYFEPHYSTARMITTKVILFLSLTDDIFDSYGTLNELQQYHDVVQRWDMEAVDQLAGYLQLHFLALDSTLKSFEDELASEGRSHCVFFLREMIKEVTRFGLMESKLIGQGCALPLEDFLQISLKTTAYQVIACASFVGMGEVATEDAFEWMTSFPKIIEATTVICRYMDDVIDYKDKPENKESHISCTVDYYMEKHGTTFQETSKRLLDMVEDAWKDLNLEILTLTTVPTPLVMRILNLARMMENMYSHVDGYNHPTWLKEYVTLLLVQPIPF